MQRRTKKQCKIVALFFASRFSNAKKFMVLETGVALPFVFLRGPSFLQKGKENRVGKENTNLPFGRVVRARRSKFY
jgi:hypothetical protein